MDKKQSFGFRFWLGWILWFAGSFVLAAGFWTLLLEGIFEKIAGPELTVSWALAVFGSWFLLVIPFMRKKEQIWKRLNRDEEDAVDAWLRAMGLFVGLLIASTFFWSAIFRERILAPHGPSWNLTWAKAVFGSWLVLLLPFLVWMYKKADHLFRTAQTRQTYQGPSFRSVMVEKSMRTLPAGLAEKLKKAAPVMPDGHIVTVVLKDGRRVPDVFVYKSREILGVYDAERMDFSPHEIMDMNPKTAGELPVYEESRWLRIDGRA